MAPQATSAPAPWEVLQLSRYISQEHSFNVNIINDATGSEKVHFWKLWQLGELERIFADSANQSRHGRGIEAL